MTDSRSGTYSAISRANHWIVSLAFFGLLAVGFFLANVELERDARAPIMALHKATGTVMLLVVAWRVIWRLRQGFPAPVPGVAAWQVAASRFVHWGLLVTIVLMPVSGFVRSAFSGRPIDMYGLFSIPAFGKENDISEPAAMVHTAAAYVLVILLVLHIGAALKHHFVDKDATLARMLTGRGVS